jgi:outer membrane protein OmpA-like peptidoglycan-associated protein
VVQLKDLVRKVQREKLQVKSIKRSGHADRLNRTGQNEHKQRLSEKRVATVKAELAKLDIALALISTAAGGNTQQIRGCDTRFKAQVDLQECPQPKRRVEVVIEAQRP